MRGFNPDDRKHLRDTFMAAELIIREIHPADHDAISELLIEAFPGAAEERLVRELRAGGHLICEIVGEYKGILAGYAAFAALDVAMEDRSVQAAALAPLAVEAALRGLGIARRLIVAGLAEVRAAGMDGVFVLGEPAYFAKFGFSNAMARKFASPFPASHMSVVEFSPGALAGSAGRLTYPPPFRDL